MKPNPRRTTMQPGYRGGDAFRERVARRRGEDDRGGARAPGTTTRVPKLRVAGSQWLASPASKPRAARGLGFFLGAAHDNRDLAELAHWALIVNSIVACVGARQPSASPAMPTAPRTTPTRTIEPPFH